MGLISSAWICCALEFAVGSLRVSTLASQTASLPHSVYSPSGVHIIHTLDVTVLH